MLEIQDRIYYTGDVKNQPGWGTIQDIQKDDVLLHLDDGRKFHIFPNAIGGVYQGHGSPRFVTARAVLLYRSSL